MSQPIKNKKVKKVVAKKVKKFHKPRVKKQEYGTSKLEERFAKEFLDKLGVKYEYQYKAEDIGRYYDFMLTTDGGGKIIIEVDGDFYHGYGLKFEQKNPMQKHNEIVDRIKNTWALWHGIPLLRIWEHDINNNSEKVMKMLKEAIGKTSKRVLINEDKKKRH